MAASISSTRHTAAAVRSPQVQSVTSTMLWAAAAVLMLSLFGLELISGHQRTLWLIFDGLVFLGAILSVRVAVFVGTACLLPALIWVLWLVNADNLQMADLLFMFLLPLACIPLSAMRSSIEARRRLDRRVTNWRMMPIHQLSGVLSYLRSQANCEQVLTAELRTSDLSFWRTLLGVEDGRERLTSLQTVLVKLIGENGWAFLDYDRARCRVLMPGMGGEQWQIRFDAAVADVTNIDVTCSAIDQVDVRDLDRIHAMEQDATAAKAAV